jgi:hypothetical protein
LGLGFRVEVRGRVRVTARRVRVRRVRVRVTERRVGVRVRVRVRVRARVRRMGLACRMRCSTPDCEPATSARNCRHCFVHSVLPAPLSPEIRIEIDERWLGLGLGLGFP